MIMSECGSGYDSDAWECAYDDYASYPSPPRMESPEASLELENFADDQPARRLLTLKELCCQFVGQNVPFETVQLYPSRIPEEVQQRIAFWAFPADRKKLLSKVALGRVTKHEVQTAKEAIVENLLQSGEID